jgi:hypothetical protein
VALVLKGIGDVWYIQLFAGASCELIDAVDLSQNDQ